MEMETNKVLEELENLVDVKKLKQSEELRTPIEDETQRQRVDAAKKRAAAQNVDYPCFAALVTCAHLKPMIRKELDSRPEFDHGRQNKSTPAWSFDVSGHLQHNTVNRGIFKHVQHDIIAIEARSEISSPLSGSQVSCFENPVFQDNEQSTPNQYNSKLLASSIIPEWRNLRKKVGDIPNLHKVKTSTPGAQRMLCSSDHFIKEWKLQSALPSSERLRFLRKFSPSSLPVIFKIEIPPFLLQEILELLCGTIIIPSKGVDGREKDKENHGVKFFMKNNHNQKTSLDCRKSDAFGSINNEKQANNKTIVNDSVTNAIDMFQRDHFLSQEISLAPYVEASDDETIVHWVASVLSHLRKCGRFGLAVKLIGQQSRHKTSKLIDYIYTIISDPNVFLVLTNGTRPMDLLVSYNCI